MGTFFDPIDNILAAAGPKEAHADAEERLVNSEMAADGAAVEHIEEETAEG